MSRLLGLRLKNKQTNPVLIKRLDFYNPPAINRNYPIKICYIQNTDLLFREIMFFEKV